MFQGQAMPPPGGATYPYPQYGQQGYVPGQMPAPNQPNIGFLYGNQMPKNPDLMPEASAIPNMPDSNEPNNWAGFADKAIRQAFIRKVYSILSLQLLFTFGMIFLFSYDPLKSYVRTYPILYFASYGIFIVFYITLVCCKSVARRYPLNIILLTILTISISYMAAVVSSYHKQQSVLFAAAITASCCLAITLFAATTKFDITSCAGFLFIASWCFFIAGIIFFAFARNDNIRKIQLVYSCIGAILFMFYLAYETQLIIGGKKYEYSPEDYVVATIQLYIDIINIFMSILSIIGGGSKN